ncbi:MAG: nicotinate-nucleotide adenylyltransferase [Geminicoccaceae bacterium]
MTKKRKTLRRPVVYINRPCAEQSFDNVPEHDRRSSLKTQPRPFTRKKIGLLGGSFNPAHEGHREISLEAIRRLELDEVWWLVSPQNPLKSTDEMASLEARLDSAANVAAGHPKLIVTDLERRLGTQYTVDTVRRLSRDHRADFVWLIGADNLVQLPKWRSWRELLNLVPIAVFDREPYSYRALAGRVARAFAAHRVRTRNAAALVRADPPAWVYFRLRRYRVSSTAIRRRGAWPIGLGPGEEAKAQDGPGEGQSS